MLFKNLVIYCLSKSYQLTAANLEEDLAKKRFRPCGKTELVTLGWVSPVPEGKTLVHESSNCLFFAACQEERLLPAAVIKEAVAEKVQEIEQEQNRKVFRKEKETIKEEVTLNLLPRAFTRKKTFHAYIDMANHWLVINTPSSASAEKITSVLRKCTGSLPLALPKMKSSPAAVMTKWLQQPQHLPGDIIFGDECELEASDETASIIRCRHQELSADEMLNHLKTGKEVKKIALQWKQAFSCIFQHDFHIKRLKFFDDIKEQQPELNDTHDPALRADAEFTLTALTLREFLHSITEAFDGLVTHAFLSGTQPVESSCPEGQHKESDAEIPAFA